MTPTGDIMNEDMICMETTIIMFNSNNGSMSLKLMSYFFRRKSL